MVCEIEKLTNIKNFILTLVHAKYSCRDDNCAPSCPSHCSEFKKVLEHIKECFDPECKVKYCVQTQQYIRHVNQCQIEDCELCAPMKERYYHHAYENAKLEARKLLAKLRRCEKLSEIHNKFEQTVDYQ